MIHRIATLFIFLLSLLTVGETAAQESGIVDELKVPDYPAFILLGVQPTSVDKPSTPSKLASTLQTFASGSGLKPNSALEATPFWYWSHPNLTYTNYVNPPTVLDNIAQTTAISLATAETRLQGDTSSTGLSIGLRTQLFSGHPNSTRAEDVLKDWISCVARFGGVLLVNVTNKLSHLDKDRAYSAAEIQSELTVVETEARSHPDKFWKDITPPPAEAENEMETQFADIVKSATEKKKPVEWISYLKSEFDSYSNKNKFVEATADKFRTASKEREGFILQVAFSSLFNFVHNQFDQSYFAKSATWVTFGWTTPDVLDLFGVVRYIHNASVIDTMDNADVGFSIGIHSEKFKISFETVARVRLAGSSATDTSGTVHGSLQYTASTRLALNFTYVLNDMFSIGGTFGKDFKDSKTTGTPLISIFGVSYNLSHLSDFATTSH